MTVVPAGLDSRPGRDGVVRPAVTRRLRRGRDDSQPVLHRTQPEDYCRHSSRPRECSQENAPRRSFGAVAEFKNKPAYLPTKLWAKMDINVEW